VPGVAVPSRPSRASKLPPAVAVSAAPAPGSPARSTDSPLRASRISSSSATVASGSFHAIAAPDDHGRGDRDTPPVAVSPAAVASGAAVGASAEAASAGPAGSIALARRARRPIAPMISLLLVAVAVGSGVFVLTNHLRDRDPAAPGPIAANNPGPREPTTGQPATGQPTTGQPATGQPATGQPTTGQPDTGQPATGQPATGQPATGRSNAGPPGTGRPNVGRPSNGRPLNGRPTTSGPLINGRPNQDGSGGATPAPLNEPPKPPMCRVRINLTPWAYYTADDDTTRHETPGTIELAPGVHRLHVWNPELHVERDITIDVPADRDTMNYSEPLQPPTLLPGPGSSRER